MFNKIINKGKKDGVQSPPPSGGNTGAPNPKPESQAQPSEAQAPTGGASLAKAKQFIEEIKSRRTIYALGKNKVLSDKDLTE